MSVNYIAVHGGAGNHGHRNEAAVKKALKRACSTALGKAATAESTSRHLDLVLSTIEVLEDDPNLNAGTGSNLTLHGTVECDASVMEGSSGDFGSVGALSGVKNPIRLAREVLEYSKTPDPLGRIPPLTLVSEGASTFAKSVYGEGSEQLIPSEASITARATDEWRKWKDRLERAQRSGITGLTLNDQETVSDIQDTVGAVASNGLKEVAAGVSSGGLLLKHPGRVGEAALFGAGCWAQWFPKVCMGIACSVSGAGEYIIRSQLAKAVADEISKAIYDDKEVDPHEVLSQVLESKFLGDTRGYSALNLDAGILLLVTETAEERTSTRVWCAFTTPSMAIAYASSANPKPNVHILRQPLIPNADSGKRQIFITAMPF